MILTEILLRWDIQTELIDGTDLSTWETALSKPAKLVFLEIPSNLVLELVDIEAVAMLSQEAGALMMVDNVFASHRSIKSH